MRGEELLKKYLEKGLNSEERFELEKLSLDDDFLADAWEGISNEDREKVRLLFTRLEKRIYTKEDNKIVPISRKLWPYAVAASLALVFSIALLLRPGNSEDELLVPDSRIADITIDDVQSPDVAIKFEESDQSKEANTQVPESTEEVNDLTNNSPLLVSSKSGASLSDPVEIPTSEAPSSDKMPNALTEEDIKSLTESERPVPIPNQQEVVSSDNLAVAGRNNIIQDSFLTNQLNTLIIPRTDSEERTQKAATPQVINQDARSRKNFSAIESETLDQANFQDTKNLKSLKLAEDVSTGNVKSSVQDSIAAQIHLTMANELFRKLKMNQKAHETALKAINAWPDWGAPYLLIGDIYASSAPSCGNEWNQSLAILSAYDKWKHAKKLILSKSDSQRVDMQMKRYRDYLPKKENGFMRGINAGDEVSVGCWIPEIVIVRFQ